MASSFYMLKFVRKKREKRRLREELNKKTVDYSSVTQCRICLKDGLIPIYDSNSFDIQDGIRTFGDIEIREDDLYPKHLCETCQSLLLGAIAFRKSAQESAKILHLSWTENSNTLDTEDNLNSIEECTKNLKCDTCNIEFNTIEEFSRHKSSKLHKNARIQCPICHRLLTPHLYKNHVLWHRSTSHIVCEVCGKLYRKDNLERHLQQHTFTLPYHCQLCPYRARAVESLRIHMRTHSGEKPFSCDKCDHQAITRSNLNRHLLTHRKEKPFKCLECGRSFYTKRESDAHFREDHSGVKDFICRVCGNKYSNRRAQMRHELRVHKRDKMGPGRMPLYLQEDYRKSEDIIK